MEEIENQEKNMSANKDPSPVKAYKLVTDELVREALQNDKGPDVELVSWEIIPFTSKGDNYSSIVVSVSVRYRKSGISHEDSYVAKLNPLRPISSFSEFGEKSYTRETQILTGIVEGMNKLLEKLGLDFIRTPKLLSQNLSKGGEAFVTENLRKQGFEMYDRMKGMDLNHSLFVVKELGRFHASSLLFEETLPTKSIGDTFEGVKGSGFEMNEEALESFGNMFSSMGEAVGKYFKESDPKYEKCSNWLLKHAYNLANYYISGFESRNHFDVLIHGDCWTNNMLFRYNEDRIPVDFRFVDLQLSSKASATTDLNYFFYTSLNGDFRRKNYNTLITTYYESFSEVMRRAGKEPPFSYLELKQELHNRKITGLAGGIMVLQFTLAEGDEIPDIENLTDDNLKEFTDAQNKNFEKMAKKEGPFRDRYIALFDDMLDISLFDEV